MARSATMISISIHHWRRKLQHERSRLSIGDRQTLRTVAQLAEHIGIVRRPLFELLERDGVVVASGHLELEGGVRGRTRDKDDVWFHPLVRVLRIDQYHVVA